MDKGQQVEVRKIWAGCAPGHGKPLWAWFKGYVFEGVEPNGLILVRGTKGLFAGAFARYSKENVRPV